MIKANYLMKIEQEKIIKHTEYDALNNAICITEGEGSAEPRTCQFAYHPNKKVSATILEDVLVDDTDYTMDDSDTSLRKLPVKKINLESHIIYNSKGKKIAEKNNNDIWSYFYL